MSFYVNWPENNMDTCNSFYLFRVAFLSFRCFSIIYCCLLVQILAIICAATIFYLLDVMGGSISCYLLRVPILGFTDYLIAIPLIPFYRIRVPGIAIPCYPISTTGQVLLEVHSNATPVNFLIVTSFPVFPFNPYPH